jgi:hypothetical protein
MKTRSSSGVGQKIDLEFDLNSLRIRDVEGGEESAQSEAPSSAIMSQIKARSQVSASNSDAEPEATASIQTNKIKDMLKNLRTVK